MRGEFDLKVVLDPPRHKLVIIGLSLLKAWTSDQGPVFPMVYEEMARYFREALRDLQLAYLKLSLYALRHGGASTDAAEGARTLPEIMQRGGWRRDWSVRRYEKHGRLANVLWRTPRSVWQDAERVEQQLQKLR